MIHPGTLPDSHSAEKGVNCRTITLLRLELEKKKTSGQNQEEKIQVCIRSESNETIHNASLAAKLKKDFRYILPERKPEESPDEFLERVEKSIPKSKDWKLRRFATVCHLSFQKITLYEDLGEDKWKDQPLHNQKLLQSVISGDKDRNNNGQCYSEDYAIDQLPDRDIVDLLVRDADSSQHSALVDALEGKNLVIEGPPGTGKSQTITNLIAACMQRGKSVLFVAEKLAALQVVKKRLDDCKCITRDGRKASLGDLCLELHSNKIRRSSVHAAIRSRLELRGRIAPPKDYEERRKNIWVQRENMRKFLDWLHQPVGKTELSYFDVIWGESRAADELGKLVDELNSIFIPNQETLKPDERAAIREAVDHYSRAYFNLRAACGDMSLNPWSWVRNNELGKFDAEILFRRIATFSSQLDIWHQYLKELSLRYEWPVFNRVADAIQLSEAFSSLSVPAIDPVILERFADHEFARAVATGCHQVEVFREAVNNLSGTLTNPAALLDWQELADLLQRLDRQVHLPGKLKNEIESEIPKCNLRIGWLEIIEVQLEAICDMLSIPAPDLTLAEIDSVLTGCDRLDSLGDDFFNLLRSDCSKSSFRSRWVSLYSEWRSAREKVNEYNGRLAKLDAVTSAELRASASVLHRSNFWQRLFSNEVKESKRLLRSIYIGSQKLNLDEQVAILREAAECRSQVERLESNPNAEHLPVHVNCSVDTDFDKLDEQLQVLWETRRQIALHSKLESFLEKLESIDADRCRAMLTKLGDSSFRQVLTLAKKEWEDDLNLNLRQLKLRQTNALGQLEEFVDLADQFRLKDDVVISVLRSVAFNLRKLLFSKHEIEAGIIPGLAGPDFTVVHSDLTSLRAACAYRKTIDKMNIPEVSHSKLYSKDASTWLDIVCKDLSGLEHVREEMAKAVLEINEIAGGVPDGADISDPAKSDLRVVESWLVVANASENLLYDHIEFIYCEGIVSQYSILTLIEKIRDKNTDRKVFGHAVDFVFYRSILQAQQHKQNLKLTRNAIEGYQQQFRELDLQLQRLTIQRVISAQDEVIIPQGVGHGPRADWTDLSLVELESSKQKRHLPLRKYLASAGTAVRKLMPCMMMSPQSVAEFLEPARDLFDIVIIDEASQMRPEEAISALARGKQLVVVGDDKQLPPTSFFMSGEGDDEGNEDEEDKAESILEMAAVTFGNIRRLRWHYRSRHDTLIQYSNKEFYDDNLVVFPSPVEGGNGLGIRYHYVEGSYCDGLNEKEADAVILLVSDLMRTHPGKSIGVATMNSKQRELILDQVNDAAEMNPAVSKYINKWEDKLEYFFVKNLENVQGDERDIIVVSTVYGRPSDGSNLRQNFGPINKQYGHRRLNVLFTRAKEAVHIVSSLKPNDIRVGESVPRGVRVFREYLQYAIDGFITRIDQGRRSVPENDFEKSVGNVIEKSGYEVVYQVGSNGYFIDIGVKGINGSGEFLLGVECDGAPFHSSNSARDRDRLRQDQLERLGWKMYRIWSTDWYRARSREEAKLINVIKDMEKSKIRIGAGDKLPAITQLIHEN